jgi:hypothetical protein
MNKRVRVSRRSKDEICNTKVVSLRRGKDLLEFKLAEQTLFIRFSESISKSNPIVITKKESKVLFNNLNWFMNQKYSISNPNEDKKYKDDNHCVLISEVLSHRGEEATPRIVINRDNDTISIFERIPSVEKTGERHSGGHVVFDFKTKKEEYYTDKTEESIVPDFAHAINCTYHRCKLYIPPKKGR